MLLFHFSKLFNNYFNPKKRTSFKPQLLTIVDKTLINCHFLFYDRIKHKWEPSFLTIPISLHSTEVSCDVRLRLLLPTRFPAFNLHLLCRKANPHLSSLCFTTGDPDGPLRFYRISPLKVLADGASSWHSYGLHCCFPPIVVRSEFAPFLVPESFLKPKLLYYLPAVRLNLPKNTLRWLTFVGFFRCYPSSAGSGSFGKMAFASVVSSSSQLSPALLSLTFWAVIYRSPD